MYTHCVYLGFLGFMSFVSWQNIPAVSLHEHYNLCISWISVAAYMVIQHVHVSYYDQKIVGFLISSITCIKLIGKWVNFISSVFCKFHSFFVHVLGSCMYIVNLENWRSLCPYLGHDFLLCDWLRHNLSGYVIAVVHF